MQVYATTAKLKAAFKKFQKLPELPLATRQIPQARAANWLADQINGLPSPALTTHGFGQFQPASK
jgi:hypothetical protein